MSFISNFMKRLRNSLLQCFDLCSSGHKMPPLFLNLYRWLDGVLWDVEQFFKKPMKSGTVLVFDVNKLSNMSQYDAVKYYGSLGVGTKLHLFVYLCPILDNGYDSGHCVLVSLDDGHIEVMRHTADFRVATQYEF